MEAPLSCPVVKLVADASPYYATDAGAAYLGDSGDLLKKVKSESIQLVFTSPPYALVRKKPYGNVEQEHYVKWFLAFSDELYRILKPDGSLVIDIGGSWIPGAPVKSTYQFELLLALTKRFYLAQDFYWWNPAKLPSPAEWVNVRRVRVKDAVDTVWWLSKSKTPKADNRRVLTPYSNRQLDLFEDGVVETTRPSGHEITGKFTQNNGGAIPGNFLRIANTDSKSHYLQRCREAGVKPHPARFPRGLPEFFVKFLTDSRSDVVLDPFSGSNMTGWVAEMQKRRWIAFEIEETYLEQSKLRWT
ncbi:MAG: site-specific DNA-methyltransferase [Nitrososphaerota archaeon]|nr:site-specific DNA-methyltransferase [Nitrososphaerota archaeon]